MRESLLLATLCSMVVATGGAGVAERAIDKEVVVAAPIETVWQT